MFTDQGEPVAVLISVDELEDLQRTRDAADIAVCEAVKAPNETGVPHVEFMAALHREDAAMPRM